MAIIRWFVAALILFFEKVFSQKSVLDDADSLAKIDEKTAKLTLFQYKSCPFCVKVSMDMKCLGQIVANKDEKRNDEARGVLLAGGKLKVSV